MTPSVSLVIPVFNGGELLRRCLQSALAQDYPQESLEVVVVDDGSTDAQTLLVLKDFSNTPYVRILSQENLGPAGARTAGLGAARGEYVFILSQDCLAQKDWVSSAVRVFVDQPEVGIVQGKILPTREIDLPLYHCMAVESFSFSFETAAIAYRAAALDKAGRYFDEVFSLPGIGAWGDDTDLAWRILELGFQSFWLDQVTAKHEVLPRRLGKEISDAARLSLFNLLVKKHPGIRQHLRWGILWGDPRRYVRLLTLFLAVISSFLYLKGRLNWQLATGNWLLFFVTHLYYGWKDNQANRCPWYYKLTLIPLHKLLTESLATLSFWWGSLKYRCVLV